MKILSEAEPRIVALELALQDPVYVKQHLLSVLSREKWKLSPPGRACFPQMQRALADLGYNAKSLETNAKEFFDVWIALGELYDIQFEIDGAT